MHNFSDSNFDVIENVNRIYQGCHKDEAFAKITVNTNGFNSMIVNVKKTIVQKIEQNTPIFVNLSQCISNFEHEFSEFPQKMLDIEKYIHCAVQISDIPEKPILKDDNQVKGTEILDVDAEIIDAPLIYDSLVQQHRIIESVDFFIKIYNLVQIRGLSITYIDDWLTQTKESLLTEIQNRLRILPLNTPTARSSFLHLNKLGFKSYGLRIFITQATQAIDDRLNSIQNSNLLQYVRETTNIIAKEIEEKVKLFFILFQDDNYIAEIMNWANMTIERKIPLNRPQLFIGNFNLIPDAISIMRKNLSILEPYGISSLFLFDMYQSYLFDIIDYAKMNSRKEIIEAINADDWCINLDGVRTADPTQYPLSNSFQHFRVTISHFLNEMKSLNYPTLFYAFSSSLREIILSYSEACEMLLRVEQKAQVFCSMILQLICINTLLLPTILKEFEEITGRPHPDEEHILAFNNRSITSITHGLVQAYVTHMSTYFKLLQIQWTSMEEIDEFFQEAAFGLHQFLTKLALPQAMADEVTNLIIEHVLVIAETAGDNIRQPFELNSFDFHWGYLGRVIENLIPREVSEKYKQGLETVSNNIAIDSQIQDSDRATYKNISKAINNAIKNAEDFDSYKFV